MQRFKAGIYYIGDPSSVISPALWQEFYEEVVDGQAQKFAGIPLFCQKTEKEDMAYFSFDDILYEIGSGTISLIPETLGKISSMINPEERMRSENSISYLFEHQGGHVFRFNQDFSVNSFDKTGMIAFGNLGTEPEELSKKYRYWRQFSFRSPEVHVILPKK